MGALDVALGLTRNKLDLARDGKGALGKAFRQRFEAEGYRFGPSGRITHGAGESEGAGSAPLDLTPGRGRQGETPSGREALGAVGRLALEPRGTAGRLWRAFRSKPRLPFPAAPSPAERAPCWASFSAKGAISALAQGKAFCYHSAAFGPEA